MAEPPTSRSQNAARTRAEILDVATAEFARLGLAGARIDEIAALTRTTKRMIYYYFHSKEQLYQAVLEQAAARLRPGWEPGDDPLAAVVGLAGLTFERYREHPDAGRVLIGQEISADTELLGRALRAGAEQGQLRPGLEPDDVLMVIEALCQYAVCHRGRLDDRTARVLTDVLVKYLV